MDAYPECVTTIHNDVYGSGGPDSGGKESTVTLGLMADRG